MPNTTDTATTTVAAIEHGPYMIIGPVQAQDFDGSHAANDFDGSLTS